MNRKLFLSPFDVVSVSAASRVINRLHEMNYLSHTNITHNLASYLFMYGVDKVSALNVEHGIKENITIDDSPLLDKIDDYEIIISWYNTYSHLYNNIAHEPDADLSKLIDFLIKLQFSIKYNYCLMVQSQFNDLKSIGYGTDINIPIGVLVDKSISVHNVVLPTVKMDIDKEDIRRLFEVVNSYEYKNYQEAHESIKSGVAIGRAAKSIELAGKDLCRKNLNILTKNDKAIVGSMSMIGDVIETLCGKIYSSLWENLFEKHINNWLKNNKCVPIYTIDGFYGTLIENQVKLYHKLHRFNWEKEDFEKK